MGLVTIPHTETDGSVAEASNAMENWNTLYTLVNGNLDSANIASSGVATTNIQDSAVITAKIGPSAVTTVKIADSAVTTAKIDDSAVTNAKLGPQAATANKIDVKQLPPGVYNIAIEPYTTTNANDSVRIVGADGNGLSATNLGYVVVDNSAGVRTSYEITASVVLDPTGAHWDHGGHGDLTAAIIKVVAGCDSQAVVWGLGIIHGRTSVTASVCSDTAADATIPEDLLVNRQVHGPIKKLVDVGWIRANFDDTGGAAEDLWSFSSDVEDRGMGPADGLWQTWNPSYTGFSTDPTAKTAWWCQVGNICHITYTDSGGTSNATGYDITAPVKAVIGEQFVIGPNVNNGSGTNEAGRLLTNAANTLMTACRDIGGINDWTAANEKSTRFAIKFRIYGAPA